jgi:hypothetical protein
MRSYFDLVHQLYECGARHFLVVNVPPTTRTPQMLLFEAWRRKIHRKVVEDFNRQLEDAVVEWRKEYPSVSLPLFFLYQTFTYYV